MRVMEEEEEDVGGTWSHQRMFACAEMDIGSVIEGGSRTCGVTVEHSIDQRY